MNDHKTNPTAFHDVNVVLEELLEAEKRVLGDQLFGMYLFGSLAYGDFDRNSDIDVMVLTEGEISPPTFAALKEMHDELGAANARRNSPWANQLEVSYLTRQNARRYDPADAQHPHLDRGTGEQLHLHAHARVIERYVLREHGVVLYGLPLKEWIDPISPDDLRRSMSEMATDWLQPMLAEAVPFETRGYQSYTVISCCRILYTRVKGAVASKPAAARWGFETLGVRWKPLIETALEGRQNPQLPPEAGDVAETLELVRFTVSEIKGAAARGTT